MLSKLQSIPIVDDTHTPSKSQNQVHVQMRTLEIQQPSPGALSTKAPSNKSFCKASFWSWRLIFRWTWTSFAAWSASLFGNLDHPTYIRVGIAEDLAMLLKSFNYSNGLKYWPVVVWRGKNIIQPQYTFSDSQLVPEYKYHAHLRNIYQPPWGSNPCEVFLKYSECAYWAGFTTPLATYYGKELA
jgi:hypothetical protein